MRLRDWAGRAVWFAWGPYLRWKYGRQMRARHLAEFQRIAKAQAAFFKRRPKHLDYRERKGGVFAVGVAAEARFVQEIIAARRAQEDRRDAERQYRLGQCHPLPPLGDSQRDG